MKPVHAIIALVFAALILLSYLALIITGDRGFMEMRGMRQKLNDLELENKALEQQNIEMYRKIKRLKDDPAYTESIARQELKMIKKDELVFEFKTETPNQEDQQKKPPPVKKR